MLRTNKGIIIIQESDLGKREIMSTATQSNQMSTQQGAQGHTGVTDTQDFLLFYPSATGANVKDAIHALYYLPKRYKLVVGKDASLIDGDQMTDGDDLLADRILFDTTTGNAAASPFSYANAVIYSDNDMNEADTTPHIVVSSNATDDISGDQDNGYTVAAGNPEALASAAMLLSKQRLAAY
jgi:hypothetical protein